MAVRGGSWNRLRATLWVGTALMVVTAGGWLPSSAAVIQVDGTTARVAWGAASGPAAGYAVFVSRNGSPSLPEQTVSGTDATLSAGPGDVLIVSVAAVDDVGNEGPRSENSDPIEFLEPPPPPEEEPPPPPPPEEEPPPPADDSSAEAPAVYFEDFEAYPDGADPADWLDTKKDSLVEDASLFETFALTDGSVAFGTASKSINIHSHLMAPGSEGWTAYEVSGLMSIDHHGAGIGVTLFSDFPSSYRYYRLRRYKRARTFRLSAHAGAKVVCEGSQDTLVDPFVNHWYRFRFQAVPEGEGTRLRANVWEDGTAEPAGWQVDCVDPDATFVAGRPGLWSMARGVKLWDEIAVTPLADTTPVEPPPADDDPDDSADPSDTGDPVPPGGPLYAESFEAYAAGDDPAGWLDTGADNSLAEVQSLFETFALSDGSMAFGTTSSETNIHSHLAAGGSGWSAYELSGSLSIADPAGGIGVTLYSDYPRSDTYYRLRRYKGRTGSLSFHLSPHSNTSVSCQGTTDTGVVPNAGFWYRFRFQAKPEAGGTRLRARVWAKGAGEPAGWQVDCLDAAGTFTSGQPGVWSMGDGLKLWDDLEVRAIGQ